MSKSHMEQLLEEIALVLMPDVCPNCDEKLSDEATTCPNCGLRLWDNAAIL